jgi:hypothetical protein
MIPITFMLRSSSPNDGHVARGGHRGKGGFCCYGFVRLSSEEGFLDDSLQIEYILFVASTTFHVPDDLLVDIDRAARARGQSRNRFVLQACREALARKGGDWPRDFFAPPANPEDERLLAEAGKELETVVLAHRRNRGAAAL